MTRIWIITVAAFVLVCALAFAYTRCTPAADAPLSPQAEDVVKVGIDTDQKQVGRDTTRAKAAAASGATNYEAGKAYATVAKTIHQQAKAHAKPTVSDTAAARLQRTLANY